MKINWSNVLEEAFGAAISAAFIALVAYLYNVFSGNTRASSWLWIGLAALVASIPVAFAWQPFRRFLNALGRWIIGNWRFVIFAVAAVLFGIGMGVIICSRQRQRFAANMPLDVALEYDFEDRQGITHTDPWGIFASGEPDTLVVANNKGNAHSGTHSLQLDAELEPEPGYTGISTSANLNNVRSVLAWVLIPLSEQTGNRNLQASLLVHGYDEDGYLIGFRGNAQILEPGFWSPVFVGVPRQITTRDGYLRWKETITDVYLIVSCDKQYSGSIYVDDVVFYTEARIAD